MKIRHLNGWLIPFIIIAAWFPIWNVSFLNDDFQIIKYHEGAGLYSIFSVFWQPDISVFYWRPIGNILHPLILLLFGFNPMPFRLLSLVLYILICYLLLRFFESAGIKKEYALIGAIIFAIIPSHEYQIAWIADQGESLVTIFLLLAFILYKRNASLAALAFTFALLTKESAFTGILIPFLYLLLPGEHKKKSLYIRDSISALLILLLILLYRYFWIGGSPFTSSHFEGTSPLRWIVNFFLYIPLSFVSPELLDIISSSVFAVVIFAVVSMVILFYVFKIYRNLSVEQKRIFWAGIGWFIIFIIPALPKLMRWYVFTASVGLILSLSVLFQNSPFYKSGSYRSLAITGFLIIFFAFIMGADINTMYSWKISGEKMKSIVKSLEANNNNDTLALFCVPEKINNVPLMKLGIMETVEYSTGKKILLFTPLRCELYSTKSNIQIIRNNDSMYTFRLIEGRFKSREAKASAFLRKENFSFSDEGYKVDVRNGIRDDISEASVYMPSGSRAIKRLYYGGNRFITF